MLDLIQIRYFVKAGVGSPSRRHIMFSSLSSCDVSAIDSQGLDLTSFEVCQMMIL